MKSLHVDIKKERRAYDIFLKSVEGILNEHHRAQRMPPYLRKIIVVVFNEETVIPKKEPTKFSCHEDNVK